MKLSEQQRLERLTITKEASASLVEDIQHMRELVARPEAPLAEIRRLSVTLRRILLNRDLSDVAAPRIGRIELNAPDNIPIIRSNEEFPIGFFSSGGIEAFGFNIRSLIIETSSQKRPKINWDRARIVKVRLDGFLSQPVLCLQGQWATRGQVIEYMANMAGGAHSGSVEATPAHKRNIYLTIARMRNVACYTRGAEGETEIVVLQNVFTDKSTEFIYRPHAIDPVSYEVAAAAHFLVTSDDTKKLEQVVEAELRANFYPPR